MTIDFLIKEGKSYKPLQTEEFESILKAGIKLFGITGGPPQKRACALSSILTAVLGGTHFVNRDTTVYYLSWNPKSSKDIEDFLNIPEIKNLKNLLVCFSKVTTVLSNAVDEVAVKLKATKLNMNYIFDMSGGFVETKRRIKL